jgi:hypothetical protein
MKQFAPYYTQSDNYISDKNLLTNENKNKT